MDGTAASAIWRTRPAKLAGLGVVAAVLAGTIQVGPATAPAVGDSLPMFAGCEQLRRWYAEAALPNVTPWGWGRGGRGRLVFSEGTVALAASAFRAPPGPVDLSITGSGPTGTNVQEAGVDEPDIAKTDGERVVVVDEGVLRVFDASGAEPAELASLALPAGVPARRLLLTGDRAVLLGTQDGTAFLTTVDLSDPMAPSVVNEERVEGHVLSARMHDGILRVVTSSGPDLDFVRPGWSRSRADALRENRQVVREASVADWLPSRYVDGVEQPLLDCAEVRHPLTAAGFHTLSVLTLDAHEPESLAATGVAADGDLVYASTDRLYVATTDGGPELWGGWLPRPMSEPLPRVAAPQQKPSPRSTQIHAFDITGSTTTYVASGQVRGLVEDRWAFSEYDGMLRVAATLGSEWSPKATVVSVLAERAGELVKVGSVGGIGRRENVEAVRWFGDIAVVVTFRQVDPLYTLDLSDPTDPLVVGELKIPGFSAYLHPVGGELLLGVGQAGNRRGWLSGAQVSTFDLGDLAEPQRTDSLDFGRRTSSPVEHNAHTFAYLPDQRLAFVPVSGGRSTGPRLAVVSVGSSGELVLANSVELSGPIWSVRTLPVGDGRVAVVSDGQLVTILSVP